MPVKDLTLVKHHLFLCNGGSCKQKGAEESTWAIREMIKESGMDEVIHTTKTLCNGRCKDGPVVIMMPENIWYGNFTKMDAERLVKDHLHKGAILKDLLLFDWRNGRRNNMKENKVKKSDWLGVTSSLLCLLHCLLTPLLLALHPALLPWVDTWEYLDYIFVGLSFIAVYYSASHSFSERITSALWILYMVFMFSMIFQHDYSWLEYTAYLASIGLASTHFINMRNFKKHLSKG